LKIQVGEGGREGGEEGGKEEEEANHHTLTFVVEAREDEIDATGDMPPPSRLGQLQHSFPHVVPTTEDEEGDFA